MSKQVYISADYSEDDGDREAGSNCSRVKTNNNNCSCTPYKQNSNGATTCRVAQTVPAIDNVGTINTYSYLPLK